MIVSTIASELMIFFLQPNLGCWCITMSQSVPWKYWITVFTVKVTVNALSTIFHSKNSPHNTSVFSSLLTAYFYLTGHSPAFIYNTTLLYIVLLALCGHLQTQHVCHALHPVSGRMGSWWLRSPVGSNTLLRPGLPLDGWLGWPDPNNRLVVLGPNFD